MRLTQRTTLLGSRRRSPYRRLLQIPRCRLLASPLRPQTLRFREMSTLPQLLRTMSELLGYSSLSMARTSAPKTPGLLTQLVGIRSAFRTARTQLARELETPLAIPRRHRSELR